MKPRLQGLTVTLTNSHFLALSACLGELLYFASYFTSELPILVLYQRDPVSNSSSILSKEKEAPPPTILCTQESPPGISHMHQNGAVFYSRGKEWCTLMCIYLSWTDKGNMSSNVTCSISHMLNSCHLKVSHCIPIAKMSHELKLLKGDHRPRWVKAGY